MTTRLIRPTLAELWRVLLSKLEGLGAEDAPGLARTLAIAGLTGRSAQAQGLRVKRRGEQVLVSANDPDEVADVQEKAGDDRTCRQARPRRRALVAS